MTPKGWISFLTAASVTLTQTCWGQRVSNWRVYKMADGLPESACVSITITAQGRALAKHLNLPSVSELDGYSVSVLPSPDLGPNRIYASPAGQLWAVTTEGLRELRDRTWVVHSVPEIAAEFRGAQPMRPVPLCPVRQGVVLFLLPDRLLEFNVEQAERPRVNLLRNAAETQLEKFSGIALARDGGLWITGSRGLAKVPGPARNLKPDSQWLEYLPPGSLDIRNFQEPLEDADGGITALAEASDSQQKRVAYFDGEDWIACSAGKARIRRAWRGPDKSFWAATIDSLFQVEPVSNEIVENQEISARNYFDVAVESNGTFWLATSDGVFRHALLPWQSPTAIRKINPLVHGMGEDAEGRFWFVSGSGLHVIENGVHREHPFPQAIERVTQSANALFPLKDGTFLVNAGETLLQFHPASGRFQLLSPGQQERRLHPLGLLPDGSICLLSSGVDTTVASRLELYDGKQFQPAPWPLPDAEPAARLVTLFASRTGDVWLSGQDGIAWYHEKKWQLFSAADNSNPEAAHSFIELPDGKLWCATPERIWEFDGKNWLVVRSGFDQVNALARSRDGSVWVASNSGLHRYFQNTWIELGPDEGLPSSNIREVFEDRLGRIWAGTTLGLSVYHPEADPDVPRAYIQERAEGETTIPEGGTITVSFTGQDKWKITPRHRLLYSYRLDERDWMPFEEPNTVSFTDLPPGKHVFQVRAMDRNGNLEADFTRAARLDFAVALPWYRETRLVFIACAGLVVALFFAGLAFNRHRQLLHSYAEVERKVAERTQELERASRELLHSQKMNALGTLAAGLAHDFNNILSIVKGSAQIIEDNVNNPEKIRTRTDRIKMVTEQGAGIVKALLGFSRDSTGQPAVCELNAVVDDTIKLLGDRFVREVEIVFERSHNLPEVRATRDFIQQILLNFIFNAAESMAQRQGKRVILATRRLDSLPMDLVLKPVSAPAHVAVSVQDFGSGIPPENLPRIFEPFFTTKALSTRRGTGLGLSMAYELAKKLEAGLVVESVVNQGTTITLILPVHELPEIPKAENHARASTS
jgi:signal transduction histidine kinase/streptogramin lyase